MAWLRLIFETHKAGAEELSEALTEMGAMAVSFEDCEDEPVLEPAPGQMPLWSRTQVTGLFEAGRSMDDVVSHLRARGAPLPPYRTEVLRDQDWVRVWMERFRPMNFGRRLWIVPRHQAPPDPSAVNLRLDPGLAFGTGTHPTTALCLQWLDGFDGRGKNMIDYGCGSGVLGIAGLLLGAEYVQGVDMDAQAWAATLENARTNGVQDRLQVGGPDMALAAADVVLANILAGPLGELAPRLARLTVPGGHIVLSGILENQAAALMRRYAAWFDIDAPVVREQWVRIHGIRKCEAEDTHRQ